MKIRSIFFIYKKHLLVFLIKLGLARGLKIYFQLKSGRVKNINPAGLLFPFSLRKHEPSDIPVFIHIFLENEYDLAFPEKPKTIIDAGAFIGLFAISIKNKFPDVQIICIEPDTDNYEILKKNTSVYDNIHCEHAGLWNKKTTLSVSDIHNFSKWGMVAQEDDKGTVNSITIPDILEKYNINRIDVLKLDIETSEKQVFKDNYEYWLPRTKMIIIELHDRVSKDCGQVFFTAISRCFKKYDYYIRGENTIIINRDI